MADIPEEVLVEILEYAFFWSYPIEEKRMSRRYFTKKEHEKRQQKRDLFLALALVSKQWKGIIRWVILSTVLSYHNNIIIDYHNIEQ